ncbi:hypothetical protein [Roseiconus lacunae]|uniref:Uncharacterized protein n=1 Tax=Roseiconus lacunae TaxID=2605694 RepID=A0ABT7PPP3_9BACT|nr:hypothetical protein [Roseiconus lacunae]MDM4018308.1 hypothetical protein [Roseiconus lacunae]
MERFDLFLQALVYTKFAARRSDATVCRSIPISSNGGLQKETGASVMNRFFTPDDA